MGADSMEYIELLILTFNCAKNAIDISAFSSQLSEWLVSKPEILVLALQEIAPPAQALLGGSHLTPYLSRFEDAVRIAAEGAYTQILAENIGLTAIMVFARDPDKVGNVDVSTVGLSSYEIGYKGSIAARLEYTQESVSLPLTFLAAHFAASEAALEQRNQDWQNTVRGLVFQGRGDDIQMATLLAKSHGHSIYDPSSHLFVAGDLNYRTSILPPAPHDHLERFPQPLNEHGSENHYLSLLQLDQLSQERAAGRTCHGLTEAPITFPPTYKYTSEGPFLLPDERISNWTWARHRWPSWCDRILYLPMPRWVKQARPGTDIVVQQYSALPLQPTTDHRAVALSIQVPLVELTSNIEAADPADSRLHPPFQVNPDWQRRRQAARRLEILCGSALYATTTWEGGVAAAGTLIGLVGVVLVLRACFGQ